MVHTVLLSESIVFMGSFLPVPYTGFGAVSAMWLILMGTVHVFLFVYELVPAIQKEIRRNLPPPSIA